MECGKLKFKSKKEALKLIRSGSRNLKNKAGRVRAYFCRPCLSWHLTTRKKDKQNYIMKPKKKYGK